MSKPLHLNPSNFIFMKGWIITLLLIISMSCNHQPDDMVGKWKTHSKHYTATFQIFEEGKKLNGLVLYYNDGTSKYNYDKNKPYYLFKGLKKKDDVYIDAMTGATTKSDTPKTLEIKKRNIDTLDVTTYIRNKPLREVWTRNKNN